MGFANTEPTTISAFRGPWLRIDLTDIPPDIALLSKNAEYNVNQVQKRTGWNSIWAAGEAITAMFNWVKNQEAQLAPTGSALAYYSATSNKIRIIPDLLTPAPIDLYTQAAYAAIFASGGERLFATTWNPGPIGPVGVGQMRVIGIDGFFQLAVDRAFFGISSYTPVAVNYTLSGPGTVTAGTHRIVYVIQSRTGFTGGLCPTAGGVLQPVSIVAPGGEQIQVTFTNAWPPEVEVISVAMSPVTNPNRFFLVDGASFAVPPGGAPFSFPVIINGDDQALQSGSEVTDNQLLLTTDENGNGPFSVTDVFEYSQRMGYVVDVPSIATTGATSAVYFSEPNDPQHITADQHIVTLPGYRKINAAFVIRNVCYLLGPFWTYAVHDTGDVPVLWPAPALVDGQIGCPCSQLAVTVNYAAGFAWVVSRRGLECFAAGQYGPRPISYYVDNEWQRINFAGAGHTIQISDDTVRQEVLLIVPLDGATTPTHVMVFNYARGISPQTIDYSLWNIADMATLGAITMVRNPTSTINEPWASRLDPGNVKRHMFAAEAGSSSDSDSGSPGVPVAIDFVYRTGLFPNADLAMGQIWKGQKIQVRVSGGGTLNSTARTLDQVRSAPLRPITLAANPGLEYTRSFPAGFNSEGFSIEFEENTTAGRVTMSGMAVYTSPYSVRRRQ